MYSSPRRTGGTSGWSPASRATADAGMPAKRPAVCALHLGLHRKTKGVVHTPPGYNLWRIPAHLRVDSSTCAEDDVHWCTATWAGFKFHRPQTYIVLWAALAGATTVMYEGAHAARNRGVWGGDREAQGEPVFITCSHGDSCLHESWPRGARSLRHGQIAQFLGTVGRTDQPEAWIWYREVIGMAAARFIEPGGTDRNGALMISPCRRATPTQAGWGRALSSFASSIARRLWSYSVRPQRRALDEGGYSGWCWSPLAGNDAHGSRLIPGAASARMLLVHNQPGDADGRPLYFAGRRRRRDAMANFLWVMGRCRRR